MNDILDQDIMYLTGVGERRKDILERELGIRTWRNLIEYYPYKYVDRSRIYRINELVEGTAFVQVRGQIVSFEEFQVICSQEEIGRSLHRWDWFC